MRRRQRPAVVTRQPAVGQLLDPMVGQHPPAAEQSRVGARIDHGVGQFTHTYGDGGRQGAQDRAGRGRQDAAGAKAVDAESGIGVL